MTWNESSGRLTKEPSASESVVFPIDDDLYGTWDSPSILAPKCSEGAMAEAKETSKRDDGVQAEWPSPKRPKMSYCWNCGVFLREKFD